MSGLMSRRKGARFEREMVKRFRDVFGEDVRRGLQSRSGEEVPDVDVPCFWVECKRERRTSPKKALAQAIGDATKGRIPIAVCKDDRCEPTVTMLLDDFLEVIGEWWEASKR